MRRTLGWSAASLTLLVFVVGLATMFATAPVIRAEDPDDEHGCISCHEKLNPGLVSQWRQSTHATAPDPVSCEACHGDAHTTNEDAHEAKEATPKVCGECHEKQVEQFKKGKHVLAEASANAIPMMGQQPKVVQEMACTGCHDVGQTREDGSVGRCDACHTRHLFSVEEARQPEACETCHMGEDHSQYEMWSSSKHGVIHHIMPEKGRAPVCQTCHMQDGDHGVITGWGFLGLRLPVPDKQWTDDTMTIVKAIGPWGRDEEGMAARVGAIQALKLARLDDETFQKLRTKMLDTCTTCHARSYAEKHLKQADEVIRETTHLLAKAVRVVEALYAEGILPETADGPKHPDLLLFYDSPTEIEQELYRMFLFHRQKAFQGAIHANPDYMHWYGWAKMKSSMQRIEALAKEMRKAKEAK
ncbi:MAG: multiheme c-type cytochrome [Planctomycetota bacterium]|nr:multiheme c-type cytochrome [Planctomycetota bacterium]